ncbi:MAG: hypothetical protein EPO40_07655 [Myxococcaceae bacterium]|nr:MAG: hypothetical protein EPO40_07655 [Myxococcaceae bacterium]
MQRLARAEVQRLTERVPDLLRVMETVLGSVFDEQGYQWSERKLRVGAAMSAVELASHSRLEKRRALWHASMVLMTLKDIDGDPDTARLLDEVAGVAHTLSLAAIACDSEVASEDAIKQARTFIEAMGEAPLTWESLLKAHRAVDDDIVYR